MSHNIQRMVCHAQMFNYVSDKSSVAELLVEIYWSTKVFNKYLFFMDNLYLFAVTASEGFYPRTSGLKDIHRDTSAKEHLR